MGWSAGNMALNFLTRLEMRHGKKWINFDSLEAPQRQSQFGCLPKDIVNSVFRLHLMTLGPYDIDIELSTTQPTFTTHHPSSIAGDTHGVESQESLALELCVQVASNAATNLRHFSICDQNRVSEPPQQPILDVYAYMDDIHRSLPEGSSYPHQHVVPYYNDGTTEINAEHAALPKIYCGDTSTNQGCFHPVIVPMRCKPPMGHIKKDQFKYQLQSIAGMLTFAQNEERMQYQKFWYMYDFASKQMVRFPAVCKCDLCPCCEKTYNHPLQLSHRFSPCPGQLPLPGVFPRLPVPGSCDCDCTLDPPPPPGMLPVPPCTAYEKACYRSWNLGLLATPYNWNAACPVGVIPYYLQ